MKKINLLLLFSLTFTALQAQSLGDLRLVPLLKEYWPTASEKGDYFTKYAYVYLGQGKRVKTYYNGTSWWSKGKRLPDSLICFDGQTKVTDVRSFRELIDKAPFVDTVKLKSDSILIDKLGLDLFFDHVFDYVLPYGSSTNEIDSSYPVKYGFYFEDIFLQNLCHVTWSKEHELIGVNCLLPQIETVKTKLKKIKTRIEQDHETDETHYELGFIAPKEQSYSGNPEILIVVFHRSVDFLSEQDTHRLFKDHYRAYFFDTEGELLELEREVQIYWYNGINKFLHRYRDRRDYSPFIRKLAEYRRRLMYLFLDKNLTVPPSARKILNQLDFIIRICDDTKPVSERRYFISSQRNIEDY